MPSSFTSEEIYSSYFSSPPVNPNGSSNNDQTEKGRFSGSTDSNIVTSQGGKKFTVDTNHTRAMINSLVDYGDVQKTDLTGETKKTFDNVFSICGKIHNTPLYGKIFEQVKDAFLERYPSPIPGSVAAFFVGCLVKPSGHFKDNPGCDPRCTGSLIPPLSNNNKCKKCDDAAFVLDEKGVIRPLNNVKDTDKAYVVILGKNFNGFTKENIVQLERKNIRKVSITRYYDDCYHQKTEFMAIDELPRNNNCNDGEGSVTTGTVVAILIIIGVILLGLLLYYFGGWGWLCRLGSGCGTKRKVCGPKVGQRSPRVGRYSSGRLPGYGGSMRYYG